MFEYTVFSGGISSTLLREPGKIDSFLIDNIFSSVIIKENYVDTFYDHYLIPKDVDNGNGRGNDLYQMIIDYFGKDYSNFLSLYIENVYFLTCPNALSRLFFEFLPINVILESKPMTFNSLGENNKSVDDFFINILRSFNDDCQTIGKILVNALKSSDSFREVMIDFAQFFFANEMVAHYLKTGENLTLFDVNDVNNRNLITGFYDNFNSLNVSMHDYTVKLALSMLAPFVGDNFYGDNVNNIHTPNRSFYRFRVGNFSSKDFIALTYGDKVANSAFGLFHSDSNIVNFFHRIQKNGYDLDYSSERESLKSLLVGSYIQLGNTLKEHVGNNSLKYDDILNFYSRIVRSESMKDAYYNKMMLNIASIYIVIAFIIISSRTNDYDNMVEELIDLMTMEEDINAGTPAQWDKIINNYVDNNGEVPLQLVIFLSINK